MLQLLVELWFWCCLFSQNNFKRATVNSTNRWHTAAYLFLALLFSGNSSLSARKLKNLISTCRILVLVVVFSFQILLEKVLKKWQLLVESWLWLLFFLFKFYLKKRWKMRISNFLVESGFWLLFFAFQILLATVLKKIQDFGRILILVVVFSFQILLEKVLNIKISKLLVESWFWLLLLPFQILLQQLLKN